MHDHVPLVAFLDADLQQAASLDHAMWFHAPARARSRG